MKKAIEVYFTSRGVIDVRATVLDETEADRVGH